MRCVDVSIGIVYVCFFFNDTATTEIYTLSLHDALPICGHVANARISARPSVLCLVEGRGEGV